MKNTNPTAPMTDERIAKLVSARAKQIERFSKEGLLDEGSTSLEQVRKANFLSELKALKYYIDCAIEDRTNN